MQAFADCLHSGRAPARIYTVAEALVEQLPFSRQSNVLAKAQSGEVLWLPADLCPQQGNEINRASDKVELLKTEQGKLLAAWPAGAALPPSFNCQGLAQRVENQVKGDPSGGEVAGVDFAAIKKIYLKKAGHAA
jgi:hypothetical protein